MKKLSEIILDTSCRSSDRMETISSTITLHYNNSEVEDELTSKETNTKNSER